MMREKLTAAMKEAMKAKDSRRLSTVRLIQAAIKDNDLENRRLGKDETSEDEIMLVFQRMVKQRKESAKIYEEAGRAELAAQENEEIAIIQSFMPEQLSEEKVDAIISAIITETGAAGMKDMGKVMATLRERYVGQLDFGKASGTIKAKLS